MPTSHQLSNLISVRLDLVHHAVFLPLLGSSLDEFLAIGLRLLIRVQAPIGMKETFDVQRSAEDRRLRKPFRRHSSWVASVDLDTRIAASPSCLATDTPNGVRSIAP